MKRLSILLFAAIGLTLTACGGDDGGGGDEDAFCDGLETLSDQVEDGDLGDNDGLSDALDTVNDTLLEAAAEGDQLDAVNAVQDLLSEADADDADDTAEEIQDELGDFADGCDIDEDEFAVAPTTTEPPETTTTTEVDDTTTTSIIDDTIIDTIPDTIPGGDDTLIEARTDPAGIAAEFTDLAEGCFQGDMSSCDQLFAITPVDSVDEAYGATCGGRIPDGAPGQCSTLITAPTPPPGDIVDTANADSCFSGDMQACDDLFNGATAGSTDQQYGGLCGFRVQNTQEFCVPIFGDFAFV